MEPAAVPDIVESPDGRRTTRPRVLLCHDMKGGYNHMADEEYLGRFVAHGGFGAIDEFVYFSHHRVTVPPKEWIDACHAEGVPCLGTLITEHADGAADNARLLLKRGGSASRAAGSI